MNLGDLKTQVKRIFGDESEVQLTNADIVRWANNAQVHFVMNNEGILEVPSFASALAGIQEYTLPTDLLVLDSVSFKASGQSSFFTLTGRSLKEFDEYLNGWDGSQYGTGTPVYFHKYANKLRLFPIPDIDGTNNIKIYYRKRPVALVNDTDIPEVPEEYHNAIVSYILEQAYFMDEDYEASQLASNKVTSDLNTNSERENWRHQKYYPVITVLPEDI